MNFIGIDSIPGSTPPFPYTFPDKEPRARNADQSSLSTPSPEHNRTGHVPSTVAQPWHLFWGATHEEASRPLPGDELIASPLGASTRCITIEAAPELVWEHLIAALFGTSSLRTAPRTGATARLRSGVSMQVREVIPSSHLLLFQMIDLESGRAVGPELPAPRRRMEWSLVLVIERIDARKSRLIVRSRMDNAPRRIISAPLAALLDMRHFAGERSLLVDVKQSAERSARAARVHPAQSASVHPASAGRSAA